MNTNLGELELRVLETLWRRPHLDVRQVRDALGEERAPSLSTVQFALERLYRETYVDRLMQGHSYSYHASVSRGRLLGRILGDVVRLLHDGKMETILSSFVQTASDLDEKLLDNLEQLIRDKRKQQDEERIYD